MQRLLEDIRFGLRNLKANPTFSLIAVVTLALGIGVTTAMFTLVNNVLLKPLPFPNAEELVYFNTFNKKKNELNQTFNINFFENLDLSETPFTALAYFAYDQATLAKGDQQKPFTMMITQSNFLSMFGTQPILGRWYEEGDVNTQSLVISHRVWEQDFASDPDILSRTIKIDNQDFEVLGVMPPQFSASGYTEVDLWKPINQLSRPLKAVGRLKPGLSVEQALTQSSAIQRVVNASSGDVENIWEVQYISMLDSIVGDSKSSLYLLMAAVFAVFFIAVLNVVNLTFAQYANRTQELAVRVSVGASRARLLRQLLTESLLLCSIGGLLGLLFSAWALEWIREFMGTRLPRLHETGLDGTTLLTVLALISVSALVTALIPAYSVVHPNKLAEAIKSAGRKVTGDVKSQRVRRALVCGEVGVAVVLLICAGLLMRSYVNLANQPTGFEPSGIVTGHIWLPDNFKPQPNRATFWLNMVDTIAQHPKVQEVAATSTMPMGRTGIDFTVNYTFPGAPAVPRGEEPSAAVRSITPGYFALLNVPISAGREFDQRDTAESPKVVIINQHLAEITWPGENAIGNVLSLPAWMGGDRTVVGVVGNVKHRGLRAVPAPEFFLPVTQHNYSGMTILVKTDASAFGEVENHMLQSSIRMEAIAPMILIESLETLTQSSIVNEKLLLTVLAIFSALALLLASIGVYGISDNMVSQRTNEIGIRMAIGAQPRMIRRWIVVDTARPVVLGAALGLILAFICGQFIASVLFGVNTYDPGTFIAVPLVLLCVGLLATWLPARRATQVHPQQALHYE